MDFIQQLQIWEKGELLQGKVKGCIRVHFFIGYIAIFKDQLELVLGA